MSRRTAVAGAVALLATAGALALVSGDDAPQARAPGPRAEVTAAQGHFGDARGGTAVFAVGDLGPGEAASGRVEMRNGGTESGLFTLRRTGTRDRPGPNGGRLSERLELTVLDVTRAGAPALVYSGGVEPLTTRPLGVLPPGARRTYRVRATAIAGQTPTVPLGGGDPYEDSSTEIELRFSAVAGLPPTRHTSLLRRRDRRDGRPDRRAPRVSLVAPPQQSVIETGRLDVVLRCSEPCRAAATAQASILPRGGARAQVVGAPSGRAVRLRVELDAQARDELRETLAAGRPVSVTFLTRARDASGNENVLRETVTLRPQA